ncbi:MAG: hypothetical protein CMI32_08145 [Opitutales bacterium]|nr:hypothetical protein [Opitutales bacterium]
MPEAERYPFSHPLLLDASSTHVHVGVPSNDGWRSMHRSDTPALVSIFEGFRHCLEEMQATADSIDAILFCEGPGSTLGLRVALTLAKTLLSRSTHSPSILTYNSLHAATLLCDDPNSPILAPYRQGQWYLHEPSGGIRVIEETEALGCAPRSHLLRQRKNWRQFAETGPEVDYDLSRLSGFGVLGAILRPVDSLALFDLRPATFRKWNHEPKLG